MNPIRGLFALPCLLLAACQMTTFERVPLAAAGTCDPALVGTWTSLDPGGDAAADGEVTVSIDAACSLRYAERQRDGTLREVPATTLHVGRHGAHAYGWVEAAWGLLAADETDVTVPAGDMIVLRYAVDGGTLSVWNTDDKTIAHAIIDGELTGRTESNGDDIVNRLTGDPSADVLDRPGFFDGDPAIFRRADPER